MKRTLLLSVLLLGFSSQSFAYFQDYYTCTSQSGRTQIQLDAFNRPDFELSKYDSRSATNVDKYGDITLQISIDGKVVPGQVHILSATNGVSKDIIEKTEDGLACRIAIAGTEIKAKAVVRMGGKSQNVDFNCTSKTILPDGVMDCE